MPYRFTIDPGHKLIVSEGWGELSDEDLVYHYGHLELDELFDPAFRQLVDLSGVTTVVAGAGGIRATARLGLFLHPHKRAVIAPADHIFGVATMFATYAEMVGEHVRIFRDRASALEWLGLPVNYEGRIGGLAPGAVAAPGSGQASVGEQPHS